MLVNIKGQNNNNLCINTDNIESFGVGRKQLENGNFAFTVCFYGATKNYFMGEFSEAKKASIAYEKVLEDLKAGKKIHDPLLTDEDC